MLAEQGRNCIRCARLICLSLGLGPDCRQDFAPSGEFMRSAMGALLLMGSGCFAAETPLRFAITDSWAMPMVQTEEGRPIQGIIPEVMTRLATQVGMPAQ